MKNFCLIILFALSMHAGARNQSDTPNVILYPNPTNGWVNLSIQSSINQSAGITFFNTSGVEILHDSVVLNAETNTFGYSLKGQNTGIYFCHVQGNAWTKTLKIVFMTDAPTRSDSIDILHYDLSLSIRNLASKTIGGTAKLKVVCNVNALNSLTLDLLKLTVSGVVMNDTDQTFSQTDSTITINLSSAKQQSDTFELAITYGGQPVTDPQWGGFYFSENYAYNMGVGFQSNPHNFGRCWFPCVDNFTDRAAYAFHITTDATFKAVCNGLMQPETPNRDGSTTWNWHQDQSIPTYLASVAVGKYEFIKYDFVGSARTYPVWIAVVAVDTTKAKVSFAKVNNALQCFEQKYGPYPFDRVGYVGVPFSSGAMEHAANIAYPNYAINGNTDYETLFAHELSHMWWGNLATCQTAEQMWLNEGWASFNEALFLECVYGKDAYTLDIQAKAIDVLLNAPKDDGAWLPVSGVPHNATYGTHVYKKGALMVHTLRALMGDDTFFKATKYYLSQYQFKDVSTDDLRGTFQQFTSEDLSAFFQKWILSPGHSDIVLGSYSKSGTQHHFEFNELSAKNTLVTNKLPFTFTAFLTNGTRFNKSLTMLVGKAIFDTVLPQNVSMLSYGINDDFKIQLAHLTQTQQITTKGSKSFPNALFSGTIQETSGNDSLTVTHHWVGPLEGNIRSQGIRPSAERYWTVSGNLSNSFKSTGFFNYDGNPTSFLDAELIIQTEDSLVLLYRPNVNTNWTIHTDNTFQPGASKTDKTGRFWVNNLQQGEYVLGIRDEKVGIKEEKAPKEIPFRIVPNPSDTEGQIRLLFNRKMYVKNVKVSDLQGKLVGSFEIGTEAENIPLTIKQLPAGQYIITVELQNGNVSQKFIRQ
jgi:hypothetical protein